MTGRLLASLALLGALAGCGQRSAPPTADTPPPPAPDMTGRTVMVLPAQFAPGAGSGVEPVPGLDAEIAFWLEQRGRLVQWVLPPAIDRALARNPSLEVRPRALAVGAFHQVEVQNIGDPLFGDLRRLGALVDARYALVPTAAAWVPRAAGSGRVEIAAALIDTMGGRVLWFGVVAGEPGAPGEHAVVATAAAALARAILR